MFSIVQAQKIRQQVERILKISGNYSGGILEMAIILDHNMDKEKVKNISADLARTLKSHSEVFRNVRLNIVDWIADDNISECVIPLPMIMMGSYFDGYKQEKQSKELKKLVEFIRLFQSRSKLIIMITDGEFVVSDVTEVKQLLYPFVIRKTFAMCFGDEEKTRKVFEAIQLKNIYME